MLDFFYWLHLHVEHNMKDDLKINRKFVYIKGEIHFNDNKSIQPSIVRVWFHNNWSAPPIHLVKNNFLTILKSTYLDY